MAKDYLINYPVLLDRLRVTARQPAPQDFNMTMAVPPALQYNIKDGGIASLISGVQLQTMYWRIDGVSEHRFETRGTQNGR